MARTGPATLRILTLNCWNVSEPFAERMALIRAGIEALQPELIGLQEIVVRSDGFDQSERILGGLGYHMTFGAAFRWTDTASLLALDEEGHGFGNLVASRWPILRSEVRELPGVESGERRSAVGVLVDAPFGAVPFVTTHFNWKFHHGNVRERQAVALMEFVREWSRETAFPPIVVGDLNAEPDSAEIRFLCGLQSLDGRSTFFQDAWRIAGDGSPGHTWDNRNPYAAWEWEPNRRIDYVLVGLPDKSGRGRIESVRLVMNESRDGVFPSDHFGVIAEVRI